MLAELTKGRTSGPEHKNGPWCAAGKKHKTSLMWDVFNVAFTRVSKYSKALSQLFSCCGRARQRALAGVRAFLTSVHAGFLFIILDQTEVSVGQDFPWIYSERKLRLIRWHFPPVVPMLTLWFAHKMSQQLLDGLYKMSCWHLWFSVNELYVAVFTLHPSNISKGNKSKTNQPCCGWLSAPIQGNRLTPALLFAFRNKEAFSSFGSS